MDDKLTGRMRKLARLVAEARDLSEVETYFHDEVVPDPAFMTAGAPARHKPLHAVVKGVARAYGCILTDEASLFHLPRFSFWHGAVGHPLTSLALIIYFDDQHRGVASFGQLSDPLHHRFRFSLPDGARDPEIEVGNVKLTSVSRQRGLA